MPWLWDRSWSPRKRPLVRQRWSPNAPRVSQPSSSMPGPIPVTVLIATRNEEANIGKCLAALGRMEQVIVLDSHSTDRTADLARAAGAEVVQFAYRGGYPKKRQWGRDTLSIR